MHVEASDRFLAQLAGVTDPETKRKRDRRDVHPRVRGGVARASTDARFLVQGTLYPDVIESGSKTAAKIKTHHNVGGLPDDMDLELVEPLRWPVQGRGPPGRRRARPARRDRLAPAVPGPRPRGPHHRRGHAPSGSRSCATPTPSIREEIRRAGLEREIWQAFAVLPAIQSVGVMGDARTYEYPIILRAVTSEDAMTADWARLPYDLLERISSRIINEVAGVNRVAYDITSKPPGTIEWE